MTTDSRRIVHGCVSNGFLWQFARLDEKEFVKELRQCGLSELSELCAAWKYVFSRTREQILAPAA